MNSENNILKWVRTLPLIIGIIFIVYGWIQSWSYQGVSSNYYSEEIAMKYTIRSYVFVISGIVIVLNGVLLGKVIKYFHSREKHLEHEINQLKKIQ
ncbi:hypothetical protein [Ornithinibacillus californiensis]|uniref:hypothetical protein n=1 Tax=Ornithinibacillus californiensis TaxID=161536 RepID=UPI00064D8AD5|nr:hypothetical protein [Ornithinibacillus californiensis]